MTKSTKTATLVALDLPPAFVKNFAGAGFRVRFVAERLDGARVSEADRRQLSSALLVALSDEEEPARELSPEEVAQWGKDMRRTQGGTGERSPKTKAKPASSSKEKRAAKPRVRTAARIGRRHAG